MNWKIMLLIMALVVTSLGCLCCCTTPGGGYSGYDYDDDIYYGTGVEGVKASTNTETTNS
ncbi:MAG: hypothetical protein KKD39_04165 [Candidatus Altiarchaeota archaeon]|nr:hypothetical protein [Candidatus Altiarchaeota archaeon]